MDLKFFTFLLLLIAVLKFPETSSNKLLIGIKNTKKLPKFICRVAFDLKRKKPDTNLIALASIEHKKDLDLIDEIAGCMPKTVLVKVIEVSFSVDNVKEKLNVRNANLVVLMCKSHEKLSHAIYSEAEKKLFNHLTKFLIISSQATERHSIASTMIANKIFNFGVVYEEEDGEPRVLIVNHFTNKSETYTRIKRDNVVATIFPEKLTNLHQYQYRVAFHLSNTVTDSDSGEPCNKYFYFLREVASVQNAKISFSSYNPKALKTELRKNFKNQNYDIALYEKSRFKRAVQLQSYEENAFCVLVPKKREILGNRQLLLSSKSNLVRLIVIVLMLTIIFIWHLFRKRGANDSKMRVLFALTAATYDRSIRMGKNRLVLTILMQTFIFAFFFKNAIFNAMFSSLMTIPVHDPSYQTFEELLESDDKFIVEHDVDDLAQTNQHYEQMKVDGRVTVVASISQETPGIGDSVIIVPCDFATDLKENLASDYYLLPEKIHPYFVHFYVGKSNPFVERLQEFMDWAFEGGLMKAWNEFYLFQKYGALRSGGSTLEPTSKFIQWKEMQRIFYYLFYGLFASIFLLVGELFYFHFGFVRLLRNFIGFWLDVCRKIRNFLRFLKKKCQRKRRPKKMQIRRIQVRPIHKV